MNRLKSKWICYLFFIFITPSFGSVGSHSSKYFEIAGLLVGIFFIWSLIKIIRTGNAKEEPELDNNHLDVLNHFIENDEQKK